MSEVCDVTVVLSTFNRSAALRLAVRALLQQELGDKVVYEVIVVDNNSTDETPEVIRQLLADDKHGRLRVINEPRQGVSYGRNSGIAAARGRIIAFTDDDNVAAPDWIARITEAFERYPEAAAIGGRVLPLWPGEVPAWLDARDWSPLALLDFGERAITTDAANPRCLLTANLAIRREILSEIGGFSPQFPRCQDHELLLRLWRAGHAALYLPELVVHADVQPERLTRKYHRRWYQTHGKYAATMRLQEIIDARGHLLTSPPQTARLLGTPGHVYRSFFDRVASWMAAVVSLRLSEARRHAHTIIYTVAYIRQNASQAWARADYSLPADFLRFMQQSSTRISNVSGISMRRMVMVHVLMALLVGGSAYDTVTGREHWPLSPYPMFSTVAREKTLSGFRLMGVVAGTGTQEIPVRQYEMLAPLDQCRLGTALARIVNNPDLSHLADEVLRDRLFHYEQRRLAGHHDGPALSAMRLYEMFWTLDSKGENVDTPDHRTLIAEEPMSAAEHRRMR